MLNKKHFQFLYNNKSLPFLPRTLSTSSSPSMAANSYLSPATFHGFSHPSEAKERCSIPNRICFNGVRIGRDHHAQLSCAMARYKQSVNGSELLFVKNIKNPDLMKGSVNGNGECGNGKKKPLGFPGKFGEEKLVVAVDVDEVLGSFLSALNKFIADRCSWNHSVSEYHVYEFFKIWKCSRKEADILVHEFFKTHYFQNGIHPIPGAFSALQHLSSFCSLSVVTSRQNAIRDHTLQWLEKHYPGLFEEIHFGNHFALDGQSKPKSEICRSLGAQFLIDDNPRYALECAEVGIKVLLFDYHNSYPWCKTGVEESHPLVTKVHNWQEVQQKLTSLVVSES